MLLRRAMMAHASSSEFSSKFLLSIYRERLNRKRTVWVALFWSVDDSIPAEEEEEEEVPSTADRHRLQLLVVWTEAPCASGRRPTFGSRSLANRKRHLEAERLCTAGVLWSRRFPPSAPASGKMLPRDLTVYDKDAVIKLHARIQSYKLR